MVEAETENDKDSILNEIKLNFVMSKLVIANFKMNGSKEFIESWAKDFLEEKIK